jgi:hypothetical protein
MFQFVDHSTQFRVSDDSRKLMGWGTQFIDVDANGVLDLFITNGHLHGTPMPSQLYVGLKQHTFHPVPAVAGSCLSNLREGRSVATADWNRDFKVDLIVTDRTASIALFQNQSECGGLIGLHVRGTTSSRDAVGTRVDVIIAHQRSSFQVTGGSGYFSSNEKTLWIGTGSHRVIDAIQVRWPSGTEETFTDIASGQEYVLLEERGLFPVGR